MKFNKKLAKTLVFALGFGAVSLLGSFNVKAAAAQAPAAVVDSHIKFDGNKAVINVGDESKATLWGFAKELKNEKGANYKKDNKFYKITDIDDIHDKIVDISSFYGKKVVLAFGSVNNLDTVTDSSAANDKWTIKEILPADKSFNIGYISKVGEKFGKLDSTTTNNTIASDYGVLAAYKIDSTSKAVEGLDPVTKEAFYEVRQGEGEWMAIKKPAAGNDPYLFESFDKDKTNPKFQMLIQNGSSLYFRLKATDNTWPGDAKKVTFKKQPNAPKITLDPLKDSSNVKYGMKVSLVKDTAQVNQKEDKSPTEGTKKATFTQLGIEEIVAGKTGTLTIYTDATKGKVKSKETVLTLTRPADIADAQASVSNQGADVITSKVSLNLKVPYDITKGAELISKDTQNEYEYYVEHGNNTNDGKVKWSKLKKAKSDKKPIKASLKYSKEAKPFTFGDSSASSKLHIRLASSKQNGNTMTLPSLKKEVTISLANVEQQMTAVGKDGVNATFNNNTNPSTIAINDIPKGKNSKDKVYKVELTMTGRQSVKSPKIKITTKVPGVSVKVGKFSKEHKAVLEIKVSKKTFSNENATAQTLDFTYSAESLKDKAVKVTLTPTN